MSAFGARPGRVVDPGRMLAYEEAARPVPITEVGGEALRRLSASRTLAAAGMEALARGAAHAATVAALEIATTPAGTEGRHDRVVGVLRRFLAATDPGRRPDLVAMSDAGLRADAERRIAPGLAPRGRLLSGWLEDSDRTRPPTPPVAPEAVDLTSEDRALFAASEGARDVDFVLSTSIAIVGDMVVLPKRGTAIEGAASLLARAALGLCVDAPASRDERLDRRRSLIHLGLTLRRRRPLVAAVLRRRLALDRAAWPAPVLQA